MSTARRLIGGRPLLATALCVVSATITAAAVAQEPGQRDSVEVVAGARYQAGGLHRWLFGSYYRDLWTTPIAVEVLDLGREAGGLTPTTAGGGFQTPSLWFRGADGYMYGFRGVDKIPDAVLPDELQDTWVESLVQDQISSQHPGGLSVVTPLLEAAGILRTDPRLVVMPDDPRLGEHRERFAGLLGYFERRATLEPGLPPFDGAVEIIDADELYERLTRSPANRVDLPAFLTARLFDYFIGDWDRHRGQWNFLRHPQDTAGSITWAVLPEDRDQAFAKFDGVVLGLARQYAPYLLNFDDDLPKASAFAWNGRDLDRRFLPELEWPVWDSVVTAFVARLPDSVIDAAVRRLPPEYYALDGERLARALMARRDQLPAKARDYYALLAGEVGIHGTDADESVTVERHADGSSDVSIRATGGALAGADPYWHRRFLDSETEELRIFLHGGADRVTVQGPSGGIPLQIVGVGPDEVENASGGGGVHYYTTDPPSTAGRVSVDTRPFVLPPKSRPTSLPPRDWGHEWRPVTWAGFGPDVGVFIGGGAFVTKFGFRKLPYASKLVLRGGFATSALTGRIDFSADVYRRNSRIRGLFDIRLSGIEVLRFNGLGNEVVLTRADDYYRVRQQLIVIDPAVSVPVGRADLALGPTFTYRRTREQDGRILQDTTLYGEGGFGQIGLRGEFELDTRDVGAAATRGIHLVMGGRVFPNMWDVAHTFGEVHGHASTYLTAARAPLAPTLALRVGGKKVWGDYPFQEAAFLGDPRTVRLGRQNRYGGDAALWGNAELRLELANLFLLLPARFGIFGLGDLGRVYLDGETSSTWHWAAGGGVWLAFLGRPNSVTLALAQSEEKLGVYASLGFAF